MTTWQIAFLAILAWLMLWAAGYIWLTRKKQDDHTPLLHSPDPLAGDAALGMLLGARPPVAQERILPHGSPAVNAATPTRDER